jgi:lipid-A-disaccharide synthase-like uncharacterized protein
MPVRGQFTGEAVPGIQRIMQPHPIRPDGPPQSIVCQGKTLSLLRQGFPLPADRCYKCNAPASTTKRKNLAWHHPAIYLTIFAGLLIYVILALVLQKRAAVQFGLCEKCNNRRILWVSIWLFVLLTSVPLFAYAISSEEFIWIAPSILAFFVGAFGAAFAARIGYPRYIDDYRIVLGGSGKAYRDTFPEG